MSATNREQGARALSLILPGAGLLKSERTGASSILRQCPAESNVCASVCCQPGRCALLTAAGIERLITPIFALAEALQQPT